MNQDFMIIFLDINGCSTNMAQLPNFRQVFPLNHQPAVQQQVPQNVGDLKGSELRLATGTIIILCGVFEIIIATYLICLGDSLHCPYYDRVGWGLWNGAVSALLKISPTSCNSLFRFTVRFVSFY